MRDTWRSYAEDQSERIMFPKSEDWYRPFYRPFNDPRNQEAEPPLRTIPDVPHPDDPKE